MEENPRQSWIPDSLSCIPIPKPRIPDSTGKISPDSLTRAEITFSIQEELVFARTDSYREIMRVKENYIQKMS